MQAESGLRLAIDHGVAGTAAVLAWPDGRWSILQIDGTTIFPSAVYVDADTIFTGQEAWNRAAEDPRGLIASPLRSGLDSVVVDDRGVSVQDLVVACLRRVGEEAQRVAGGPVPDVRLVVPAGWGPRRRTWMRQAAYRAGLGQPTLVDAPVAAAGQLLAHGVQFGVGSFVLVCDAGAGFEATVLRRGPSGFEVLSTLADADAGGDRVDELLADYLRSVCGSVDPSESSPSDQWALRVGARAAKEALSQAPAVTVPMPALVPPVVLDAGTVRALACPVVNRAAELAASAVAAAELKSEQLAGVYSIGAGARSPDLTSAIGEKLGVAPVVVNEPGLAAVFGAVQAGAGGPAPQDMVAELPTPPFRRILAMAIPAACSLLLLVHVLYTADFGGGGSRSYQSPYSWVIVNWGELAVAGLMALVGCLAIGSVFGTVITGLERSTGWQRAESPAVQVATGVLTATAIGTAAAGLYAVLGSLYLHTSAGPFLQWALLPAAPTAVVALLIAAVIARRSVFPVGGWDRFLAFPMSSVIATSVGTLLVQQSMKTANTGVLGWVGGFLIGVGIAALLVSRWVLRLVVALPLGVVLASAVSWPSTGIMAVIYAIAVTLWWAFRLWQLLRSPSGGHTYRAAAYPAAGVRARAD